MLNQKKELTTKRYISIDYLKKLIKIKLVKIILLNNLINMNISKLYFVILLFIFFYIDL